jgi:hypothetical protein
MSLGRTVTCVGGSRTNQDIASKPQERLQTRDGRNW